MKKIILVLLLSFIILGCIQKTTIQKPVPTKITIIDQAGRKVEIPKKVDRIVSLWPEATRVLFALGLQKKIVGLDTDSKKDPILNAAFPNFLKNIPDVGSSVRGTLSIEKIAKLKPDIIFVRTEDKSLADKIQQTLGIPVVCVRMDKFNPPRTSFEIIKIIGKCVGKERRAEELVNYLESKLSYIRSKIRDIPEKDRPKVYAASPFNINAEITLATSIKIAGGKSFSAYCKNWVCTISFEQIAKWDPNIILLHAFGKYTLKSLKTSPEWSKLRAVREGKVYRILFGYVGKDPGLFVINVLSEAKIFYPQIFHYNLDKIANGIFKEEYGVSGVYTKLKKEFNLSL